MSFALAVISALRCGFPAKVVHVHAFRVRGCGISVTTASAKIEKKREKRQLESLSRQKCHGGGCHPDCLGQISSPSPSLPTTRYNFLEMVLEGIGDKNTAIDMT